MSFAIFSVISSALPFLISQLLATSYSLTIQQSHLLKSFSLLVLGMSLSTLATLNFSLAFIVGLLAAPLSFVQPTKGQPLRWVLAGLLNLVAPPVIIYAVAAAFDQDIGQVLQEASFGWHVWGMYTPIVVWSVWWPAWLVGMVNTLGFPAA
jgi:GPI-anchor transamidase subunit GAA1